MVLVAHVAGGQLLILVGQSGAVIVLVRVVGHFFACGGIVDVARIIQLAVVQPVGDVTGKHVGLVVVTVSVKHLHFFAESRFAEAFATLFTISRLDADTNGVPLCQSYT